MQYRTFGRLDFNVSALGFGAMRLPTMQKGEERVVDEAEATKMIYYAIDQGVNYVDTAYPYHGGQSELLLGKILQGEYREKVKLATKLPSWKIEETTDFDKYFEEQWERLQTDRIDFYLLHTLNKNYWPKLRDLGVLEWAENKIKEGRIGHLGFSFHDKPPVFLDIVDAYDWTFCQVQYNYIDIHDQAGTAGVKHAASKGIAVVVMEPILGGRLVDPPQKIRALWDTAETKRTPADWALQWLWNQQEVATVLSGMSTLQQTEENVVSAEKSRVGKLSEAELALVDKVREQYKALSAIPCTACEYCLPCPAGVNIPRNFGAYNMGLMYEKPEIARKSYNLWMPEAQRAMNCTQCQECEEKCPQSIPISQWMPIVHEVLGENKPYRKSL
jgi:predicted aldo/keto reductase-like oxidoreductase